VHYEKRDEVSGRRDDNGQKVQSLRKVYSDHAKTEEDAALTPF